MHMKHLIRAFCLVIIILLLSGCSIEKVKEEKLKDIEFTIVEEDEIPEELLATIEEKKGSEFKATFADKESLYIIRGYGKQQTGGYSISVNELYLTENAIYVKTNLIGPSGGETASEAESYPYVVVKMEFMDKSVVFE